MEPKQAMVYKNCLADKNAIKVPCTPSSERYSSKWVLAQKPSLYTFLLPEKNFERAFSLHPRPKHGGGFDLLRCIYLTAKK